MKKVTDYLGNEFKSVKEMCNAYGIDYAKYVNTAKRIKANKDKPPKKKAKKPRATSRKGVTLSDGRTFRSVMEAAKACDIPYGAVMTRIHKYKWDVEKALLTPKSVNKTAVSCTDGVNQYSSIGEMARALGVNKNLLYQRYHRGKDLLMDKSCKDHLGNVYPNKSAMYKAYGVTSNQFSARISQGRTLEEALTGVYDTQFTCFDHLGNKFKSEREMCKAHHVSFNTYRVRKRKGYMLEQCLARELDWREHCFDHLGIEYKTIKEMCEAYGVKRHTFECRIRKGMTLEQALTEKGA